MPKDAKLQNIWIKFLNHANVQSLNNAPVCEKTLRRNTLTEKVSELV